MSSNIVNNQVYKNIWIIRSLNNVQRIKWTPEEDEILKNAVNKYEGKNWKKIAEFFTNKNQVQCLHRWQKVLNPSVYKGPWSEAVFI